MAVTLPVENGRVTLPAGEGFVCEVRARWSDAAGNGGTATYGFWVQR